VSEIPAEHQPGAQGCTASPDGATAPTLSRSAPPPSGREKSVSLAERGKLFPGKEQGHGCLKESRCHLVDEYSVTVLITLNVTSKSIKRTTNHHGVGSATSASQRAGSPPLQC